MLLEHGIKLTALGIVGAMASASWAGFGTFGAMNNDGDSLTFGALAAPTPTLDFDPIIPGFDLPRGFGSFYFGAGETHDGEPLTLWDGEPTDVGWVMIHLAHDGASVTEGLRVAVGELGAFEDIFVFGIAPTDTAGLGESMLLVPADAIAAAQSGDPSDPSYVNHHHVYLEADAAGTWEATFKLIDMSEAPLYAESISFTLSFVAIPEPTMIGLLMFGAMVSRRHR